MLAALLAALSSGMWGVADFLGGVASRRAGPTQVLLISYPAGALVLTVVAIWVVPGRLSGEVLLWGVLAGSIGLVSMVLLYRALVQGPMGIVSPVSAVVAGAIPVSIGLARGERLGPAALVGMVGAVLAVFLASRERGMTLAISRTTLFTAIGSGIGIGGFLATIGSAPTESGVWASVISRWWAGLVIVVFLVATSKVRLPAQYPWLLVIIVGSLDALANGVFQLAAQQGLLAIVAVIGSLYPATTVVLAWLFLRERLAPAQVVGVVLAIGSAALLATAA